MAIVETVPAQVEVGQTWTISGTGYTSGGDLVIEAHSDDGNGGLSIDKLTLHLGTGITALTADDVQIAAQHEGHVHVSITDVTAAVTNTHEVEVFEVGGL